MSSVIMQSLTFITSTVSMKITTLKFLWHAGQLASWQAGLSAHHWSLHRLTFFRSVKNFAHLNSVKTNDVPNRNRWKFFHGLVEQCDHQFIISFQWLIGDTQNLMEVWKQPYNLQVTVCTALQLHVVTFYCIKYM